MANINIKIQKKDLWILSAIMIFLIGVGYVVAYNSGATPNIMGHSFGELENVQYKITTGLTACSAANQAIKTINPDTGAVVCEADDVGTGDITNVIAGTGLTGGGASGAVTLSRTAPECTTVKVTGAMSASVTANCPAGYTAILGYANGVPVIWGDEGGTTYLLPNANSATAVHQEGLAGFTFTVWARCCR